MSKRKTPVSLKYNLPAQKPFTPLDGLNANIETAFKTKKHKMVALIGDRGSGKTTAAVGFSRMPENSTKLVVYLSSFSQDKLDFEYRQFAYEYLHIPMYDRNRTELIEEVKIHLENQNQSVIFVFDDVQNLKDVKEYVSQRPEFSQVIITMTTEFISKTDLKKHGYTPIMIELMTREEAMDFLEQKLDQKVLSQHQIAQLIDQLDQSNQGIFPRDLEICCSFANNSNLNGDECLKELFSKSSVLESVLSFIEEKYGNKNRLAIYLSMLDPDRIPIELVQEFYYEQWVIIFLIKYLLILRKNDILIQKINKIY